MRVTTGMVFDTGISTIQKQTASLLHTQQQVSTGRRIVSPSDDPVASARALEVGQSKAVNARFSVNQGTAQDSLALAESHLGSVEDLLAYVRTRAVEAGNGSYSQSEFDSIAADLRGQFDALVGIANSRDATGDYLFAGYKTDTQPFVGDLAGVRYEGDQGDRTLQVSASRNIPVSSNGEDLFVNIPGAGAGRDVFSMIADFVTALESGTGVSGAAQTAIGEMDLALDNVLTKHAAIGSRMVELDSLTSISGDLDVQYASTLSRLVDVDYAQAISDLTQQQTYLQASQQSYLRVTGLSLFDYLS
ncbi:MAG: flagellar hook-associated protein FlgL [Rhodocyclaceae bacterium]|nr:flagellar hook-associated protein FlgL [Rhodocyclaceae bacterium]